MVESVAERFMVNWEIFRDKTLVEVHYSTNYNIFKGNPANTLRKSNVILRLYFGNLRKLLSANVDVT